MEHPITKVSCVVRVRLHIPLNKRDSFLSQIHKTATAVRERDGCIRFDVLEDTVDQNAFMLYEEWSSRTTLEAYKASQQFADAGAVLFPMLEGKPDSAYYATTLVGP